MQQPEQSNHDDLYSADSSIQEVSNHEKSPHTIISSDDDQIKQSQSFKAKNRENIVSTTSEDNERVSSQELKQDQKVNKGTQQKKSSTTQKDKYMSSNIQQESSKLIKQKGSNAYVIGSKQIIEKPTSRLSAKKGSIISQKNFIQQNKQVTTMRSIQQKFTEKVKERQSISATRKNSILMSPRGLALSPSNSRLHEWSTINVNNRVMLSPCASQTSLKNQSKDFVVKHVEVTFEDLKKGGAATNNLGGTFSKSKREKAYHLTNSSSITNLHSFKALDIEEKGEYKEFPTTKGNQQLKVIMNKSNVFADTNKYLPTERPPSEFNSHNPKSPTIRNINNTQVQSSRLKNLSSKVL